ncbi:hypothetical protein [Blastomonas fulva]|uniref:hypothetical protein n=1 Tax=Blastomonas fulva TaxID=1550728 RepID=UPI0013C30EE7|nr:hypothetical protein [Blastomonas fulva]
MRRIKIALALALSAASVMTPPAWTMAPKDSQAMPMDFSHVTSRAQAEALVKRGELVRIRFFPKRFGGRGDRENIGYVPPGALMMIDFANDRVSGLIDLKAIDRLVVEPKYRGKSIVPVQIVYICSGEGEATIDMTLNIW